MPSSETRNYNTISPSARSLLLLKGHTTIPYAREAAALIQYPEPWEPDLSNRHPGFWIRVMHFEARYQSINGLLSELLPPIAAAATDASSGPAPQPVNILEISSGFSFRGLSLATERAVNYIDTDLPDVIATKQRLIDALTARTTAPGNGQSEESAANGLRGHYELRPLNALDTTAFQAIIDSMPPGPIYIVNEGLLMYLGKEEKQRHGDCDPHNRDLATQPHPAPQPDTKTRETATYSLLKLLTGFANPAFNAWKLTVSIVIPNAPDAAAAKIHHGIPVCFS